MKKIWVSIPDWNESMVITAIEGGSNGLVLPEGCVDLASQLGKIITISKDGDLLPEVDVIFYKLKSVEDEIKITELSKSKIVVVECKDWKIIPLENIIAKGNRKNVILKTGDIEDAKIVFGILEKGLGGILIETEDKINLKNILLELNCFNFDEKSDLKTALVDSVQCVGMGDRVCVDTCTSMSLGQGILVGNISSFFFLMHAENIVSSYIDQRPFRINAGAVHAYTRMPYGRTSYLSELSAGSTILLTDYLGNTEKAVVGRVKIEKRPLLLVKVTYNDCNGTTIVQNAETIRFVLPDGTPKSVTKLKVGDEIIVSTENYARHFGYKIDEYIYEK